MVEYNIGRLGKVSGITFGISAIGAYVILSALLGNSFSFQGLGSLGSVGIFVYIGWITIIAPLIGYSIVERFLIGDKYDNEEILYALVIGSVPFTFSAVNIFLGSGVLNQVAEAIAFIAILPGFALYTVGVPFLAGFALGAGLFSVMGVIFAGLVERNTELN